MSRPTEPNDRYRMWGGRFKDLPDPRLSALLSAPPVSRHLLRWDLLASIAHVLSLAEASAIPPPEATRLARALREMLTEADAGSLIPSTEHEDVHTFIEATLTSRIGASAGWLQTGRSRNDQVVTAFRLLLRDRVRRLAGSISSLQSTLLDRAGEVWGVMLPGYTHLQRAQPVLLSHHWLAYFWMLLRDIDRFRDAYARIDVCPLGSGAIAGTGFPVDRARQARLLGFARPSENSIDATGNRDFAFEPIACVSCFLVGISRWAEELVLWTSREFGFVDLPDAISTGSSLMPQKQNPDLLELTRAQAGVGLGQLVVLAAVLKGVPPAYNLDLREDKTPTLAAFDAGDLAAGAMNLVVERLVVRRDRMEAALRGGYLTATEAADYLVRRGVPFREAHHLAGRVVLEAEGADQELWEAPVETFKRVSPLFDSDVLEAVSIEGALAAKDVSGGTAPTRVAQSLADARKALAAHRRWIERADAAHRAVEKRLLTAPRGVSGT